MAIPKILALESPTYQPAMRIINALTVAENATVTTSFDHNYLVGLIVRLLIPSEFGMIQANNLVGTITSVPGSDSFVVDIDTRGFDSFVLASSAVPLPWYINDYATVVSIGEINSSLKQATKNVL